MNNGRRKYIFYNITYDNVLYYYTLKSRPLVAPRENTARARAFFSPNHLAGRDISLTAPHSFCYDKAFVLL